MLGTFRKLWNAPHLRNEEEKIEKKHKKAKHAKDHKKYRQTKAKKKIMEQTRSDNISISSSSRSSSRSSSQSSSSEILSERVCAKIDPYPEEDEPPVPREHKIKNRKRKPMQAKTSSSSEDSSKDDKIPAQADPSSEQYVDAYKIMNPYGAPGAIIAPSIPPRSELKDQKNPLLDVEKLLDLINACKKIGSTPSEHEEYECVVCMENKKCMVNLPCMHVTMCPNCVNDFITKRITKIFVDFDTSDAFCIVCDKVITDIKQIFI